MHIEWATLGAIAVVAAAAAVTVVVLVSLALVGLSARSVTEIDGRAPGARATYGVAVATICLVAAGLIVAYALYLIVA